MKEKVDERWGFRSADAVVNLVRVRDVYAIEVDDEPTAKVISRLEGESFEDYGKRAYEEYKAILDLRLKK